MSIWIEITFVSLLVAAITFWSIFSARTSQKTSDTEEENGAVALEKRLYQQRLSELEADIVRGALDEGAAQEARAELGRALIANAERAGSGLQKITQKNSAVAVSAVLILLAIGAAYGLYSQIGTPQLHAQPIAKTSALTIDTANLEEAIARVELQMRQTPDDVRGWQVLAPIYRRIGEIEKATHAMRQIIFLDGPTLETRTELAELLLLADGPANQAEAKLLLEAARAAAPEEVRPRFMLAIIAMQEQRYAEAIELWQGLIDGSGRNATGNAARAELQWLGIAKEGLAQAKAMLNPQAQPPSEPVEDQLAGPSEDDITAAGEMDGADRQELINNMVVTLTQRLQNEGGSLAEWQRLLRSLMVLKRPEKATEMLALGLQKLDEPTDQQALREIAIELGIEVPTQTKETN